MRFTRDDVGAVLEEISKRVYRLEQSASGPRVGGGGGGGMGDNPSVDTITVGGVVIAAISTPPTGLVLSTGSFMEDVWVDASWTAPVDLNVEGYNVELAKKVSGVYQLEQVYRTGGTSIRMNALLPQTVYGVRVQTINRIGVRSTYLPSSGFTDITTGIDATVPAQVSNVQISAGFRSVVITWNEVSDRDVARGSGQYLVELATDSGFTTGLRSKHVTGTITSFTDLVVNTTYYTRVTAIDNSGNSGAVSATANATTGKVGSGDIAAGAVGTTEIQNAAITNALIANLAVDNAKIADLSAAKINAGTLSADRIAANSLDVEKLSSSTMTTVQLTIGTSGAIKVGTPPTTGLLINNQGLRLYSGGVVKVILDVTGDATFKGNVDASTITATDMTGGTITGSTITGGTIRSGSSGRRVAIESAADIDKIKFYSGSGSETQPGYMNAGVGGDIIEAGFSAPKAGTRDFGFVRVVSRTSDSLSAFTEVAVLNTSNQSRGSLTMYSNETSYGRCGVFSELEVVAVHLAPDIGSGGARVTMTHFNEVTTVVGIKAPGGSASASLCVYDGAGNKILVNDFSGNTRAAIEASAFDVSSRVEGKRDISDVGEALGKLAAARVVKYRRPVLDPAKPGVDSEAYRWGLLVEEVKSWLPDAVVYDANGVAVAIEVVTVLAFALKCLQELQALVPQRRSS